MTTPLTTVCEHCSAKLKLKNPDLEGKKIRCPECGEVFVVVAAPSTSVVKKPEKKKPKSNDDDSSFMDVDPDDYDSPQDDEDDQDQDEAPRSRRSSSLRSGKKKTRKKSKGGGGDGMQVIKILIAILGVAVVLGGAGYAVMSLARGDGTSELDWLPTNVAGFMKMQVDDLWATPILQKFRDSGNGKKMVEELNKESGMKPEDLDFVVVGLFNDNNPNNAVVVMRAKKQFDSEAISKADGSKMVTHGSALYYKKDAMTVAFLPDHKTLVRGSETSIQALIDRGKKHPLEGKFAFGKNYHDHFVMALIDGPGNTNSPLKGLGGEVGETLLLRANASTDVRFTGDIRFKDAVIAKKNFDKAKIDLEKLKSDGAKSKTQIENAPPNPIVSKEVVLKMLNAAEQVLNTVQISQSGSSMLMQVNVPGQVITDFVDAAGTIPNSPMNRLPFSTRR